MSRVPRNPKPKRDHASEAQFFAATGGEALEIGEMLADLNLAQSCLVRVIERGKAEVMIGTKVGKAIRLSQVELDFVFSAFHAVRALTGALKQRDPWGKK